MTRALFLIAIALIALHVIDDSFIQPQPGTSAGDHLVSGLVPLALLSLAAWAYPRLSIGGLGLSVGGEMMIQTAAETNALRAVASEGAGMRSLREAVDTPPSADTWLGLPFKAVETAATAVFHDQAPPASLVDLVAKIEPRPLSVGN